MYCKNCEHLLNQEDKFCSNCGSTVNIQDTEINLNTNKSLTKLKKLILISAIIEFIYALALVWFIFSLFGIGPGEASGFFLLVIPFILAFAIFFLVIAILNIQNTKKIKLSNIKTISIIEILSVLILGVYGIPMLTIAIIKLCSLSKIK